jgi:hypothetical protein
MKLATLLSACRVTNFMINAVVVGKIAGLDRTTQSHYVPRSTTAIKTRAPRRAPRVKPTPPHEAGSRRGASGRAALATKAELIVTSR